MNQNIRTMKKIVKIISGFFLLISLIYGFLYFFGTTDLQTESVKKDPQVAKAHG